MDMDDVKSESQASHLSSTPGAINSRRWRERHRDRYLMLKKAQNARRRAKLAPRDEKKTEEQPARRQPFDESIWW